MEKSLIQCLRNYVVTHPATLSYCEARDYPMAFKTQAPPNAPFYYNPIPWNDYETSRRREEADDVWETL